MEDRDALAGRAAGTGGDRSGGDGRAGRAEARGGDGRANVRGDADDAQVLFNLGNLLAQRGDGPGAEAQYSTALRLAPVAFPGGRTAPGVAARKQRDGRAASGRAAGGSETDFVSAGVMTLTQGTRRARENRDRPDQSWARKKRSAIHSAPRAGLG